MYCVCRNMCTCIICAHVTCIHSVQYRHYVCTVLYVCCTLCAVCAVKPLYSAPYNPPNRSSTKPLIHQTAHPPNPLIHQTAHPPNRSSTKPLIHQTAHPPNRSSTKPAHPPNPLVHQTVHLPYSIHKRLTVCAVFKPN